MVILLTSKLAFQPFYSFARRVAAQAKVTELEQSLLDVKEAAASAAKEQSKLMNRVKDLKKASSFAESKVVKECNKHKFDQSIAAIKRDFESTRMDMGCTSTTPLSVFCVAASTYLRYQIKGSIIGLGFASRSDTEIPSLRDWLVKFTYAGREDIARSIVDRTEFLIATMKPWIEDRRGDIKLSELDRAQLASILEKEVKILVQVRVE